MKSRLAFILIISLLLSCNNEKEEMKNLTEVFKLNSNRKLMEDLGGDNDSISFGWTYGYNLNGKKKEINIKIFNQKNLEPVQRKSKLKNDSEKISSALKNNLSNLSYFNKLNFYLISSNKVTDSLKVDVKDFTD